MSSGAQPLRLGMMCAHNPFNRNAFSGTPFYMRRALEGHDDVELVVTGGHQTVPEGLIGCGHAVPFRIDLDTLPSAASEKPALEPLHLLFTGQDWQRKGGNIALQTLAALRSHGVDIVLTVFASNPPRLEAT